MNKKRILSLLVILMMVAMTFSACGGSGKVDSDLSMAGDVQNYVDAVDIDYAYDLAYTLSYDEQYQDNELGWRTAGSDAEHRTADFLMGEMEKIGLTDVEKVPVKVDKFQFNDSSLTIEGTDIDLMPASYQASGTDADGITAEIVNVGTGTDAEYEGVDVEGKIVLVGVDQWNESWIDGYIRQAHAEGAAAIVTYDVGGYAALNDDITNVQDICCPDLIPTVAISANEGKQIIEAIEAGNNKATLMVDAELVDNGGTSYNVVGKIKGKSSDQQIILASHYDKYWYGFQDNSCAVALTFAVGKAIVDSGYVPENDIIIVAHGSEEWGATDTQFDWTIGAWEMIHTAHPEWAEKTILMINTELPAFVPEGNVLTLTTVPEFRTLAKKLIDSGLFVPCGDVTFNTKIADCTNMEDGVSYRWHGVPYVINGFEDETFITQRYHTAADDKDTWDADVMQTNINWYGAMTIYVDKTPALELDMTQTPADLVANLNDDVAKDAGIDVDAYKAKASEFDSTAAAHNEKIADVNARYEQAVKDGASEEELQSIRDEGKKLNKVSLKAFKASQDEFLKADDVNVYIGHPTVNDNIVTLQTIIAGLDNKTLWAEDEESGALDAAWNLNSVHDYGYYLFDEDVVTAINVMYDPVLADRDTLFWGTDKLVPVYYVGETTAELIEDDANGEPIDWDGAKAVYQGALDQAYDDAKAYAEQEIEGMDKIINILK